MTTLYRLIRVAAAAGAIAALTAPAAWAQAGVPHATDRPWPHAAPWAGDDLIGRAQALDARIVRLVEDVEMFTGELRIEAMAALLKALVDRQVLLHEEVRRMHGMLLDEGGHDRDGDDLLERSLPAPPADLEPEAMCSPFI